MCREDYQSDEDYIEFLLAEIKSQEDYEIKLYGIIARRNEELKKIPSIIIAFTKGATILYADRESGNWEVATTPAWDFTMFDYKVKD